MKYISPLPTGFQVRLPEFENGVIKPHSYQSHTKHFTDLDKAIVYRNTYLKKHNALDLLDNKYRAKKPSLHSKRNRSGIIGVSRGYTTKICGLYYHWKAGWMKDDTQHHKQFSVNLYSEEGAFLWACKTRYQHAGILIVTDYSVLPCEPPCPYQLPDGTVRHPDNTP